jgi:hypothetical protein
VLNGSDIRIAAMALPAAIVSAQQTRTTAGNGHTRLTATAAMATKAVARKTAEETP